jgi:hypothetical protein
MFVDIAARIGELGRQPRTARKFFDKHQDRIVFGTDASAGTSTPQQTFGDALYEIYFRFLETEDEYFDYAPAPVPPQGRWRISGLGLSEQILRKVYREERGSPDWYPGVTRSNRMKRILRRACLLAFTAGLAIGSGQIESKQAQRDASAIRPEFRLLARSRAGLAEGDREGNPVPGHRTEIRSRWTGRNLYFLFTCPYEQLNLKPEPKAETETNQLWNGMCRSIYRFGPKNIRRYKEFEISPQGEWVDLDIDLDAPRHEDGWVWNSGFQVSARIDQATKTWYAFMRIPYAAVDTRAAATGNTLRVNFFRRQGSPPNRKAIVWQPTHRPTFHVPEVFGTLRLVD